MTGRQPHGCTRGVCAQCGDVMKARPPEVSPAIPFALAPLRGSAHGCDAPRGAACLRCCAKQRSFGSRSHCKIRSGAAICLKPSCQALYKGDLMNFMDVYSSSKVRPESMCFKDALKDAHTDLEETRQLRYACSASSFTRVCSCSDTHGSVSSAVNYTALLCMRYR
ncbi:uncharacterized protein LAESUDRAFT_529406 [Laetiporus sulphureus 93-53]|uniref:Uncharacterized protein n=1 Tax=Laetiporus sulphureus 93-53 TaxID=1314785 RepID=A0A165BBZ1_9APHY|nr:uncharacterized protein LAESUDRAFT_529406 [Laetiporus sulphureus 93-53]KZT00704.1 hypothetical protein LAESUDRAFT_529406 [Laetiporus sulphureus 93-53]